MDPLMCPGYGFYPRDYELIMYFLKKRIEEGHLQVLIPEKLNRIREVQDDIFIHSPPDLLKKHGLDSNKEWYILSSLKRTYFKDDIGRRLATKIAVDEGGYWKFITRKEVNSRRDEVRTLVGHKLIYQFYQPTTGSAGAVPTLWLMVLHTALPKDETDIASDTTDKLGDQIVMCKIFYGEHVKANTMDHINDQTVLEWETFKKKAAKDNADVITKKEDQID